MTATAAPAEAARRRFRHRHELTAEEQASRVLLTGKPARLRPAQMLAWSLVTGLLGAAFVAGLYYGVLEVHWYVHIGPVHFPLFWLKQWWDAGAWWPARIGHWAVYRHASFRDLLEPEVATMAVMTLLARPRWWRVRVSTARLVTAPLVLLAAALALNAVAVWLLYFAWPAAPWNHGVLARSSAAVLLAGFGIGRVLHRFWAPVGATLQGELIERAVCRAASRGAVPLRVRWPLLPPVVRERFGMLWRHGGAITARGASRRWLIAAITVFAVLVTALGAAGHYWAGVLHHTIPYLAPGGH